MKKRYRIEFTVEKDDWSEDSIKESAIQELECMVPFPDDITFSEANPWHTEPPTKEGVSLILHILSNEDDIEGYYQSGYYEQNRWFKWNGCGIALDCGEYVDKWAYEKE